jgi:hypothetical protein
MAMFRNQAPLGQANYSNTYYVLNSSTQWGLVRRINDSATTIGYTGLSSSGLTWEHWRIVFWDGINPSYQEALCVEVYKEIEGEWIKQGDTIYDTASQWKTSEINRIGFHCTTANSKRQCWDDTEIWKAI